MRCPLDVDVDLVMTERQGVEIDYCPTCRGVWLDRGELDKILERSAIDLAARPPQQQAPFVERGHAAPESRRDHDHDRSWRDEQKHHKHHKHGPRSFLHDLFD